MSERKDWYERAMEETMATIEGIAHGVKDSGLSPRSIYLVWLAYKNVADQAGVLEQMIPAPEQAAAGRMFYRLLQALVDGARKTDRPDG